MPGPRLLTIGDVLLIAAAVLRLLIFEIPLFSFSLATGRGIPADSPSHGMQFGELLQLMFIRRLNILLPPRALRWLTDLGLPEKILTSPRYFPHAGHLFAEVSVSPSHSDTSFHGRWIVRNAIVNPESDDPRDSDVVILYLHGGGYTNSSPASYLLFLLILAETIIRGGKSVSIFALDYDLAPEARFPTQLEQARDCYRWLIGDIGISPVRMLVMGDSAGGHLALSLLIDLWKPPGEDVGQGGQEDLRPGIGLVLISPWLSLFHQPDSFRRNEVSDVLTGPFLRRIAVRFLGPGYARPWPNRSQYLEFLDLEGEICWDDVLPDWVWVSAGKNEILYDDIVRWIVDRGSDCSGASRICGEVDRDEAHVYSWLSTTDPQARERYFSQQIDAVSTSNEYAAVQRIGAAILDRMQTK